MLRELVLIRHHSRRLSHLFKAARTTLSCFKGSTSLSTGERLPMKSHRLPLAAGLSAALILASTGFASADDRPLDEIIVTAQKREERLIDVPMSITAIKGEDLVQRNIANIQDLSFAVPGLTTQEDGPGSYTIFMRG